MTALDTGLAKLRRSTELALAYPDVTIVRAEAHAILEHLDSALAAAERAVALAEAVTEALELIPPDAIDIGIRIKLLSALEKRPL